MESHNNRPRFTHTYALFKRILYPRALSLCYVMQSAERGSLEKQAEMEEDARCKLWPGGCGLMGKCFLLQVRRTLVSCSRHVDSPQRRSARSYECNRSALVSRLILCGEIYARSAIAFIHPLRTLEVAVWKEFTRYVEEVCFSEITRNCENRLRIAGKENCKIADSTCRFGRCLKRLHS